MKVLKVCPQCGTYHYDDRCIICSAKEKAIIINALRGKKNSIQQRKVSKQ